MTIVWSARVQNATTSAPKLDLPLSPLTMGCWDAITIKATTASLCTPHTTPDVRLALQKTVTLFFFYHFPQIVPLCPALLELRGERGSLNLNIFDETGREWVRVQKSMCVFVMCNEQHTFPFIPQRPVWDMVDASQVETPSVPLSQNPAGLRPLWFSTFFSPCSPLSLFLSHYLFHSRLILSSLDLLDAVVALKVVLEKGKIIGNKVNTLVGA